MKILLLTSRFPYPLEKGDKLRAFYQIKYLSQYFEIVLCAINPCLPTTKQLKALQPFCKQIYVLKQSKFNGFLNIALAVVKNMPFQVAFFYSKKNYNRIQQIIALEKPDAIYCQLIRTAEYVKHIQNIPKTIDYMDAMSIGLKRRFENAIWWQKFALKIEYLRVKNYETNIFNFFENKLIISEQDRQFIHHAKNQEINVIPNGIDTNFFKPINCKKTHQILFVGNMQYFPNIQAVLFLVNKVLPIVYQYLPNVKVLIAGASPTSEIIKLNSEKVSVTGFVPDIRTCYATSELFVAPMQLGSGLQNKLLEAMAMGIPCITSTICNNALQAPNNCIVIANNALEYAKSIVELLNNSKKSIEMAENAKYWVIKNYDWQHFAGRLNKIISINA